MGRNQDQGVCYHRQMPETKAVCLESGPRCLKPRQMYTEIMVSVAGNQGQYVHNLPEIQANLPRNQNQGVRYHGQHA